MTSDKEWNNFVSSWQSRKDDDRKDSNYYEHKGHDRKRSKKHCSNDDDRHSKVNEELVNIQTAIQSFCRSIGISVPVTVTPFSVQGKPVAKSAGEIEMKPCDEHRKNPCCKSRKNPGNECCKNECSGYKYTITQKMNVDIPMLFGAEICFDKACAEDAGECKKDKGDC